MSTSAPPPIWLASQSPRRKQLLQEIGLPFEVAVNSSPEPATPGNISDSNGLAELMAVAEGKAKGAFAELSGPAGESGVLIAADTVVSLDGDILGKPDDESEARKMLARLSGATHQVITSVSVLSFASAKIERMRSIAEVSTVTFMVLPPATINGYVATGEPLDKAGAYGIQGRAGAFVSNVSGSYSNIVGLPLAETLALLEDVSGYHWGAWLD